MTAVLIPTASEAEWLEARRQGITASEIAVVMGLSPYSSPYALYHQKLGNLPQQEDSLAMAIGRRLEGFVCDLFAEQHPEWYVHGDGRELYAHPDRPWQMATPDRLVYESHHPYPGRELATYDAKTAASYDGWGDEGSDEIPVHYRCQKLWQMDVAGVTTGYLGCLFLHSRQFRVYELTMDMHAAGDLELMRHHAEQFLKRLDAGDEPDIDWRPATTDALKRLHPSVEDRDAIVRVRTASAYRTAVLRYRAAEQRKNEMTNRLRAEMGSAQRAVTARGVPVATRQVYDVREHTRKPSTVDKLVPAKAPKEPSA